MIRKKTRTLIVFLVVGIAGVAAWAAEGRLIIKGSENPQAIPFGSAVNMFYSAALATYDANPPVGIKRIQRIDDTIDEATAVAFLGYMRKTKAAYMTTSEEAMRTVCSRRGELASHKQIAGALASHEATMQATYEKSFRDAQYILGNERMDKFERYINKQIRSAMSTEIPDAEKELRATGEPAAIVAKMCDRV